MISFISRSFSAVTLLTLITVRAYGQWADVGPGSAVNPDQLRHMYCLAPVGDQALWASPVHPTFQDVREVVRTVNGGVDWDVLLLPETDGNHLPVRIFAVSEDEAWVLALRYPSPNRCRLFHTTDGGVTWVERTGPFNDTNRGVQNIHFFNEQEGIVFGSPRTGTASIDIIRIFRTSDGGDTWTELFDPNVPLQIEGDSYFLFSGNGSYAAVGDTLWFLTTQNRVYRTADRGQNWQRIPTDLPGSTTIAGLAGVAFRDALNGMVVSFNPQQGAVTSNGGTIWTPIDMPPTPTARSVQHIPGTENTYVLTDGYEGNSGDISITFDGGQTWETLSGNPGMNAVEFLSTTQGWGGANISGSVGGIFRWEADLETILSVQTLNESNTVVYPNPVNDRLHIRIEPAGTIDGQITLYDLSGRVHLQEYIRDVGVATVNVGRLPAGMYILTVASEGVAFQQKIVKTTASR